MDKSSQIKRLIRDVVGNQINLPITAKVIKVGKESCTIELDSGLELSDVRLKATINNANDYYIISPAIGSNVIVLSMTGNLDNLILLTIDQVAKIEVQQKGLQFIVDGNDQKISIKNEAASLLDIFKDLTRLLKDLKVYTANGPSGVPLPNTMNALIALEQQFNQLLK